jgi:hypothetical protein
MSFNFGSTVTNDFSTFSDDEKLNYALKLALNRVQTWGKTPWYQEPRVITSTLPNLTLKNKIPPKSEILEYYIVDPDLGKATDRKVKQAVDSPDYNDLTIANIESSTYDSSIPIRAQSEDQTVEITNGSDTKILLKGISKTMIAKYVYWKNQLTGKLTNSDGTFVTTASDGDTKGTYPDKTAPFSSFMTLSDGAGHTKAPDINDRRWSTMMEGKTYSTLFNDLETLYSGLEIIHWNNIEANGNAPANKRHPFFKIFIGLPTYSTYSDILRGQLDNIGVESSKSGDNIGFTNKLLEAAMGSINDYPFYISAWNKVTKTFIRKMEDTYGDPDNLNILYFLSYSGFILNYGEKNILDGKDSSIDDTSISIKYPPTISFVKYTGETFSDGIISQGDTLPAVEVSNDKDLFINTTDNTIHRLKEDGVNKEWIPIGGSGNSDISFNDTKPSSVPPDFEENQLFVDTSNNIIFRVDDNNGNKSFKQISEKILTGVNDPSGNTDGYLHQLYIRNIAPPELYYNYGSKQWAKIGTGSGTSSSGVSGGTQPVDDQILKQTSDEITVSQQLLGTDEYEDIEGSSIAYTFPSGSTKVIYRFSFNLTWNELNNRGDTISEYRLGISTSNGNDYTYISKRFTLRNSVFSENFVTIEHVIKEEDYAGITNIKLVGKSINSEFKQKIHKTYYPYEQDVNPILELVTLGTRIIQAAPLFNRNLDSSIYYNAGNVGINTAEPSQALDVSGNINTGKINLQYDNEINCNYDNKTLYLNYQDGDVNIANSGAETKFGGPVTIGTTSPDARLNVKYNTGTTGSGTHTIVKLELACNDDTTVSNGYGASLRWGVPRDGGGPHEAGYMDCYIYEGAGTVGDYYAYDFRLRSDEVINTVMTMRANGNVGIGTKDPQAKLHIAHTEDVSEDVSEDIISLRAEGTIRTYAPDADSHIRSEITSHVNGGKLQLYNGYQPTSTKPSNTNEIQVKLSAKDSETSYIDNGGKVGIGTTNPSSTLHVYGGVSIGEAGAASNGDLIVAGSINGATITSTGTISGATITSTGTISGDTITSTGTISGATITSTGNITLYGADIDSYSANGLALQSAPDINNSNVKIPAGKLVVGSSGNATYPLEVYGSIVRGFSWTPYLDFGSVGIHVQEDQAWDQYNQIVYVAATGSSGRNIFVKNYGSRNISIWSQDYVACAGIQQVSDERIKINIRDISDNISLQKLRDISCCLYEYKDPLSRDFYTQLGFIAQQVNKHLPLAISFIKDIIPNEMRIIENPQWSKIIDGSNNKFKLTIPDLEDVSGNTKYKFYMSNDISGNDECEKISSTLEDERKSFIFDQSWNYVYLYGKEVDDFHRINKDKLFALNFSATQEIDRIQQQQLIDISGNTLNIAKNETDIELLKLENSELKTENADLKTELATLKTQMTDVLSRLSQLESN